MGFDGFGLKPQELTLSYLCKNNNNNNQKMGFSLKGKEVIISENSNQDEKWVERHFMNLSKTKCDSSSKRPVPREEDEEEVEEHSSRDKKPKLESTLNLSLALPDVSLSLTASNALQNVDPLIELNSHEFLGAATTALAATLSNNNNAQTTCSNDFTATSLSYSYSPPFLHNPSCSLTRNSAENYEYSVGRDDQIWCGGEGTNGSVHSRFKPIGDGIVALNNNSHGGGGYVMQGNCVTNKDLCNNSLYKTTSSDDLSFFPSKLLDKRHVDSYSGDFKRWVAEKWHSVLLV